VHLNRWWSDLNTCTAYSIIASTDLHVYRNAYSAMLRLAWRTRLGPPARSRLHCSKKHVSDAGRRFESRLHNAANGVQCSSVNAAVLRPQVPLAMRLRPPSIV
jgi:hypothetical protein